MIDSVKLICLYGPESVGKTTLAEQLAAHYQTVFVHEVARDLITSNDLTLDDYVRIGHAQTRAVLDALPKANQLLICDTDLITTALYSQVYLNDVPPVLAELEKQVPYDLYFLLNIDVPWVADGLRDLGHRREDMYQLFKTALKERGIDYIDVSGTWEQRWDTVTWEIDRLLA
ncbi:AAA family ATPase [Larkinella sp. VNQ87]|uniref:AAA family ATPase n=1 Tax=Larkinella sp. VNQ87 TaxID=3400921 RepID=UPI003C11DFD0